MTNAQHIYEAVRDNPETGQHVIVHGRSFALHEQNGGWSSLFDEAGAERYSVSPQGDIWREAEGPHDGHEIIANFGETASVVVPGDIVPWYHRTPEGEIHIGAPATI